MDFVHIRKDDKHVKKEKLKAKELKQSRWWKDILAKGVCHYCKNKFTPNQLTLDHIVPVSRGGTSTKNNCVPACDKCNKEKSVMTPVEMILQKIKDEQKL